MGRDFRLRRVERLLRFGDFVVERFGDNRRYSGNERIINRVVEGRSARVGDFRRHGVELFVHIVFQLRPLELACKQRGHVFAEIAGNNERRICLARRNFRHGVVIIGEFPIQLRIFVQLIHDLVAQLQIAKQVVVRALILIHDAHLQRTGIVVRIPETHHVEPGVQRRQNNEHENNDPACRGFRDSFQIAHKHAEYVVHAHLL